MQTWWRTLCAAVVGVAVAWPAPSGAGPNLLPNPSFEESVLEPPPVPQYLMPQPVLPTGWAFEGLAGLFDHGVPTGGRQAHSGQRFVAISIPAGTKRQLCADPPVGCQDNPLQPAKDALALAYTVNPHWRNLVPVPVDSGGVYLLSVWVQLEFVTVGAGAVTAVRWLDGAGVPLALTPGPARVRTDVDPDTGMAWEQIAGYLRAPPAAAQAVVLLGHSDDLWLGQVRFDDVFFGPA